ncbi:metal-dependent hydrolase [Mycobacteroides abscessus subsp. abscessus]|nr:metal-dependent hydrolase [Mycobacteroides abscessus subsp. abscessus]
MRIIRFFGLAVGAVALLAAAFGFTSRFLPVTNHVVLVGAAFAPYLMACGVVAIIAFGIRRRWLLTSVAAALVIAGVAVEVPLFISTAPQSDTVRLRVLTANLYLGQGHPGVVVATAEQSADIVALQELTPGMRRSLAIAGLDQAFPYQVLDPRPEASGTGLWSRYPVSEQAIHPGYVNGLISARIHVPDVTFEPTVLVAHMAGPWPQPIAHWGDDMRRAVQSVHEAASAGGQGCVLVAGDFNATYDMAPFRAIAADGFRDGAEQSGSGLIPTYPANLQVPPLLAIDHVMTNRCTATSVRSVVIPGSDHRGLLSTVEVPRRG